VRAVARFRDFDGSTRLIERTAGSATAARHRVKEAARDRGRTDSASEISAETRVSTLAEAWYGELLVAAGDRSPTTAQLYRDRIDNQVLPAIGGVRLREVTVSRVDRLLKVTVERNGPAMAKATRAVLPGMFGLAVGMTRCPRTRSGTSRASGSGRRSGRH
jgi:hypothetical protein